MALKSQEGIAFRRDKVWGFVTTFDYFWGTIFNFVFPFYKIIEIDKLPQNTNMIIVISRIVL